MVSRVEGGPLGRVEVRKVSRAGGGAPGEGGGRVVSRAEGRGVVVSRWGRGSWAAGGAGMARRMEGGAGVVSRADSLGALQPALHMFPEFSPHFLRLFPARFPAGHTKQQAFHKSVIALI